MKKFVLIRIGCIECSCDSGIVGVFDNESLANTISEECNYKLHWLDGGQNIFKVFQLPEESNQITEEYRDLLIKGGVLHLEG